MARSAPLSRQRFGDRVLAQAERDLTISVERAAHSGRPAAVAGATSGNDVGGAPAPGPALPPARFECVAAARGPSGVAWRGGSMPAPRTHAKCSPLAVSRNASSLAAAAAAEAAAADLLPRPRSPLHLFSLASPGVLPPWGPATARPPPRPPPPPTRATHPTPSSIQPSSIIP
ncbi:forkhead box protein L2-like [Schistocerca piceifrons]|uniref:forkhead box protein L2-like n=1 Tax=Schistocerca piceifrons TaxID=274613 RepID=UPI001F5F7595|nr:forkhead box protein L2-like [Schistocerca piceifrons]